MKKNHFYHLLVVIALMLILPFSIQAKSDNSNRGGNSSGDSNRNEHAVMGNVDRVQGNTVVLEDKKENKKTEVEVGRDAKVVGSQNKPMKLNQIKKNDTVAIISSDSAEPKRAVKVFVREASAAAQSKRHAIQGIISGIDGSVLTLVHQIQRDRIARVLLTSQTIIKSKSTEASSSAGLQVGIRVAVIGDLNSSGQLVAKMIHIIPGKAVGIFKKNPLSSASATPSSSPSATPSATPEASSSATP